jgi:hypothetical protein
VRLTSTHRARGAACDSKPAGQLRGDATTYRANAARVERTLGRRPSCLCHIAAAAKRRRETTCRQAEPRRLGRVCTDIIAVRSVHFDGLRKFPDDSTSRGTLAQVLRLHDSNTARHKSALPIRRRLLRQRRKSSNKLAVGDCLAARLRKRAEQRVCLGSSHICCLQAECIEKLRLIQSCCARSCG